MIERGRTSARSKIVKIRRNLKDGLKLLSNKKGETIARVIRYL